MYKILFATLFTTLLFGHHNIEIPHKPLYFIVKGLFITGDKVEEKDATLDAGEGYGFGLDLGYHLTEAFAIEYDFSYATNKTKEIKEKTISSQSTTTYYTSAIDFVYTFEIHHVGGIFGKVGYEYEKEINNRLNFNKDDFGLIYGAGIEAVINHSYKWIVEYEHSTIEATHGDSIFAGLMYSF